MFSSLSTLFSRANISPSSTSNATTKILSAAQSQSFGEKIPLTSKQKVEKKLASILTQIQQDQIKHLSLTSTSIGRFYEPAHTLCGHKSSVCSLTVLKNGALASGSGNPENAIKIWSLASHSCLSTLQGHTDSVWALAVLPNNMLASGSRDSTIKLWSLSSNSCLSTLQGHAWGICALAVLPNNMLASGSRDSTIKLWDLTSGSCLSTLQGHTDSVYALTALPNGLLASGSNDNTIKLWNSATNSCLSTLQGHVSAVSALAFLPNGYLVSGSDDTTIKLWDLATNSCLTTLQGYTDWVRTLVALPDGLLASNYYDSTIKLWDLASHSCLAALEGHTGTIWSLAVFPNGLLASGSCDKTIKLWEPKTLSTLHLQAILNALKNNASVTDLDLSGNRDISDDIMSPLISIFAPDTSFGSKPNSSLKAIDLRRTGVSQKGVKQLVKAIQHQRLSIEVMSDCPVEWIMISFLIIFCRANRNSPFADSGLELCKYGEIGPFLDIPSGFFPRSRKSPLSISITPSPS